MCFHLVIGFAMRIIGPCFCCGFYYLMAKHTWVFLTIICPVLRKRLGFTFGLIWTVIGVVITYNVVWNHMLAMCLKPGSPKDLTVSQFLSSFLNVCACIYRGQNSCVSIRRSEAARRRMSKTTVGPAVNPQASRVEGTKG